MKAFTLDSEYVCADPDVDGRITWENRDKIYSRTHKSGWTISGKIHEDYFTWVNEFEARHPTHGKVWGNFEKEVYSESEEGYNHFYTNHPPKAWDYGDI